MAASAVFKSKLQPAGLVLLLLGQVLAQVDFSIVYVAIDAIGRSLHAGQMELELVIALYGVSFAVCLAMGGRLGDNFGRRRIYWWGVTSFTVASLLCGVAGNIWILIAARVLQGGAAALAVPQILATIHVSLTGHSHSKALAFFGATTGIAFTAGQVLGGLLISWDIAGLGWRSVFLINLPVGLLIMACSRRFLPETRSTEKIQVDWQGMWILAIVILALLIPMALGPATQWPWQYLGILSAVPLLFYAFWRVELHQERRGVFPLMPPSLLRLSSVRLGICIAILFFGSWSGFMFSMALTLQTGAGMPAASLGDSFVALGLAYFAASLLTSRAVTHFSKSAVLVFGCIVKVLGALGLILTLRWMWPHPSVANMMPATIPIGFGQAFIVGCFFRISLSEVSPRYAGAASAMLSTLQQSALGLGPAISGLVLAHFLPPDGDYKAAITAVLVLDAVLIGCLGVGTVVYESRRRANAQGFTKA